MKLQLNLISTEIRLNVFSANYKYESKSQAPCTSEIIRVCIIYIKLNHNYVRMKGNKRTISQKNPKYFYQRWKVIKMDFKKAKAKI